jgi:hypothetical protein
MNQGKSIVLVEEKQRVTRDSSPIMGRFLSDGGSMMEEGAVGSINLDFHLTS